MGTVPEVPKQLLKYLASPEGSTRKWATRKDPMDLSYDVPPDQWREILDVTDLSPEVRASTDVVLESVEDAGGKVGRALLLDLSNAAKTDAATGHELVSLWFATMCWGAGPRRNFRLRQWTRALTSPVLRERLQASHEHLVAGRLADAYRNSKLPGVGESYLTKWLWALGLAGNSGGATPYVLDARVWGTLRLLGWSPSGSNAAERWVDYCATLDKWAVALCAARPDWHVDGERIEQLLFERGDDTCLFEVLSATV